MKDWTLPALLLVAVSVASILAYRSTLPGCSRADAPNEAIVHEPEGADEVVVPSQEFLDELMAFEGGDPEEPADQELIDENGGWTFQLPRCLMLHDGLYHWETVPYWAGDMPSPPDEAEKVLLVFKPGCPKGE
jgi:hypothetical protein